MAVEPEVTCPDVFNGCPRFYLSRSVAAESSSCLLSEAIGESLRLISFGKTEAFEPACKLFSAHQIESFATVSSRLRTFCVSCNFNWPPARPLVSSMYPCHIYSRNMKCMQCACTYISVCESFCI